jgi:hypothetical protein
MPGCKVAYLLLSSLLQVHLVERSHLEERTIFGHCKQMGWIATYRLVMAHLCSPANLIAIHRYAMLSILPAALLHNRSHSMCELMCMSSSRSSMQCSTKAVCLEALRLTHYCWCPSSLGAMHPNNSHGVTSGCGSPHLRAHKPFGVHSHRIYLQEWHPRRPRAARAHAWQHHGCAHGCCSKRRAHLCPWCRCLCAPGCRIPCAPAAI